MAKRILVVEDNDLNRKLFCDVLKSQGYAVEPCADGLEALDRARQFVPNLIIMDIQLPNVSGLDLIEAAKKHAVLRPIPVRTMTAFMTRPFLTRPRGIASLTETTIVSPIVAYLRFEPPSTLMHMTRRAPELSATRRFVCIWIMLRSLHR